MFNTIRDLIITLNGQAMKATGPVDLPNRDQLERELTRELGKIQSAHVARIIELMGNPPNMANIPAEYWNTAGEELRKALSRFLNRVYLEQAQTFLTRTTIGVDWALINRDAAAWAARYTFDLVRGIEDTDRTLLQDAITRYFEDGQTRDELEQVLRERFGDYRSEMIATTEITRAASNGEIGAARQVMEDNPSIEMIPIWQTNADELVCEVCGPLNGMEQGDGWTEPPPAHPNCRCWINHDMRIRGERKN